MFFDVSQVADRVGNKCQVHLLVFAEWMKLFLEAFIFNNSIWRLQISLSGFSMLKGKIGISFNRLSSFKWNYPISISCFLEHVNSIFKISKNSRSCFSDDIDPAFKSSKNRLNGSSGMFDLCLFHFLVSDILRFPEIIFSKIVRDFLELFDIMCCLQS